MLKLDTHQHFWKYNPANAWPGPELTALHRDFLPSDLKPVLEEAGVSGCIAVQTAQTTAETEWLLTLAQLNPFIKGVVGWTNLCAPDIEELLAGLQPSGKLKGFRHLLQDEPDDAFMLRADFRRGLKALERYGHTYDLVIYPRHLACALTVCTEFPGINFIIDHAAKPGSPAIYAFWAAAIKKFAGLGNVSCKISGLVTEASPSSGSFSSVAGLAGNAGPSQGGQSGTGPSTFRNEDYSPVLDMVLDTFGPDRILYGSDWPVFLQVSDYTRVLELAAFTVRTLSGPEQLAFWSGNARRVYRISD